jgi:hypothetical protein
LTGSRAGEGVVVAEDWTVLLPHAAKARLRNTRMLNVATKREGGFLMIVSPQVPSKSSYKTLRRMRKKVLHIG